MDSDRKDREVEEVTERVSGSPADGLWITYLSSGLPAMITDTLMKSKTKLDGKHKQTRTHTLGEIKKIKKLTKRKISLFKKRSLYNM